LRERWQIEFPFFEGDRDLCLYIIRLVREEFKPV
jgi:hypothetical protein